MFISNPNFNHVRRLAKSHPFAQLQQVWLFAALTSENSVAARKKGPPQWALSSGKGLHRPGEEGVTALRVNALSVLKASLPPHPTQFYNENDYHSQYKSALNHKNFVLLFETAVRRTHRGWCLSYMGPNRGRTSVTRWSLFGHSRPLILSDKPLFLSIDSNHQQHTTQVDRESLIRKMRLMLM